MRRERLETTRSGCNPCYCWRRTAAEATTRRSGRVGQFRSAGRALELPGEPRSARSTPDDYAKAPAAQANASRTHTRRAANDRKKRQDMAWEIGNRKPKSFFANAPNQFLLAAQKLPAASVPPCRSTLPTSGRSHGASQLLVMLDRCRTPAARCFAAGMSRHAHSIGREHRAGGSKPLSVGRRAREARVTRPISKTPHADPPARGMLPQRALRCDGSASAN